jgi:hypothetical protein
MMDRRTQYERMIGHLRVAGRHGLTYLDLTLLCRSLSPWKRIAELEDRGYKFRRWTVPHNHRRMTVIALVSVPKHSA